MDVDNEGSMGFTGSLEPSADDCISEFLLQQFGSYGRNCRRETRASCTRIVSEMYSPPRVTAELRRSKKRFRNVFLGSAFDLTVNDPADNQPWDFSKPVKQERARRIMREQRPYMLIGSPMCTHFSTWQYLNEHQSSDAEAVRKPRRTPSGTSSLWSAYTSSSTRQAGTSYTSILAGPTRGSFEEW